MQLLPSPHAVWTVFLFFFFFITALFLVFSIVFVPANLNDELQHTIARRCPIEAAFKKNYDEMLRLVANTGCAFTVPISINQNSVI